MQQPGGELGTNSPLLTKWKDYFGGRRHDLEISGPILEEDDFERRRRHLDAAMVSHVLVIRKFGNIGITATQLSLLPGDVVEVLEKYPVGYWRGKHNGREGIFDADCCVPCKPDGEPLEPIPPAEPGEMREVVVEDAETSESHGGGDGGGGGGGGEEEESGWVKRAGTRKRVPLKKVALRSPRPSDEPMVSPRSEQQLDQQQEQQKQDQQQQQQKREEQKRGNVQEEEDSVSVSIDPHLLDSIGESPRGVMAMLRSRGSRGAMAAAAAAAIDDQQGSGLNSRKQVKSPSGRDSGNSGGINSGFSTKEEFFSAYNLTDATIVRLNIGGTKFATTLPTICKYPDSMLAAMFSGRFGKPQMDQEGYYFIDRDGSHFRFILNFLRDGTVVLPDDPRQLKEILKEAIYFQLPQLVKDILRSGRRKGVCEFLTVRYLPGSTYDGWPIRIEGTLLPNWVKELNGDGTMPPERESDAGVRNMFGRAPVWKMRGVFLTSIFNVLSQAGWKLTSSNGSGAGIEPKITFAELYVFSRHCNASSELHTLS